MTGFARAARYLQTNEMGEPDFLNYLYEGQVLDANPNGFGRLIHGYNN